MGLFSTLFNDVTPSDGVGSTNTNSSLKGTTTTTSSSSSTTTTTTTTNLPTIIQLYMNHPIPFIAVDTAIVANDILDYNDYISSTSTETATTTSSTAPLSPHHHMKQRSNYIMKRYNMNTWITSSSSSLSTLSSNSFAPIQYYAVQCIPPQEYMTNQSSTSTSSNNKSSDKSIVTVLQQQQQQQQLQQQSSSSSSSLSNTMIPVNSLRNTFSTYQQKQFNELSTKYVTPDLGIYNCRCSINSSTSVSSSSSSSSLMDCMIPLVSSSSSLTTTTTTTTLTNTTNNNIYCMVVDMSSVHQYSVIETHITMIQQILIRYLIQVQHSSIPSSTSTTTKTTESVTQQMQQQQTSLHQLRTVQFGLANQDTTTNASIDKKTKASDSMNNDNSKNVYITLQICVLMDCSNYRTPTSTSTSSNVQLPDDYTAQQMKHLLMYHLRKYAAALNATLLFVTCSNDSSTTTSTVLEAIDEKNTPSQATPNDMDVQQPTIHVRDLPWVWKAYASGQPIWQYNTIDAIENAMNDRATNDTITNQPIIVDDTATDSTTTNTNNVSDNGDSNNNIYSLIYGPENHNTEFIESVLIRNASYPGHWDANTDSIWKILIPPSSTTNDSSTIAKLSGGSNNNIGDQIWFKEIYDTIVPIMSSSSAAPTSTSDTKTTTPSSTTTTAAANILSGLQTPPPNPNKANTTTQPPSSAKTPNDAAVSSFFEDLLK